MTCDLSLPIVILQTKLKEWELEHSIQMHRESICHNDQLEIVKQLNKSYEKNVDALKKAICILQNATNS